jgi:outer membrane protein assembly factor BamA
VPDGDKLYVGIDYINYSNYEDNDHFANTKIEVDAALALPPNGSLFGSSTMRSPFQPRLMIWNYFSKKDSKFADWMTKSFGRPPVLLSGVNPELRASVAQSALQAHGYFRGKVTSEVVDTRHPKKGKVGYTVDLGHLFTVDTLEYVNFPTEAKALIDSTAKEALIHSNDPFDISTLDNERNRVSTLLRDNGYYFYQPGYASYLADTLSLPGSAKMKLQLADSLPPQALRKYYIGKVDFDLRKTMRETLDNHNSRRNFTVNFHGRKQPMRMGVILRDVKLRSGNLFSYSDYQETMSKLTGNGLFSMVNFTFTPRDSLAATDTLDMRVNCVFDKPYDFYIEGNINGKTSGFFGPQLVVGLTKRNAFKGGEKLNVNLHGSYEWLLSRPFDEDISDMNSYE